MSEPAVDVNSRTSLARQWWKLQKEDFTKKGVVATTVLNWGFAALSIWMYIGPHFESRGADNAQATLSQLNKDKAALEGDVKHWSETANKNQLANDELIGQKADHVAKIQELERKLEAATNGEGPKTPVAKQEAALTPPINKVKVRKVPLKPADPTTWEQFVAWYEKNVGAPGVN